MADKTGLSLVSDYARQLLRLRVVWFARSLRQAP